ncbi:MAG: thiazole synthase [Gemmatimonadetes bacterium]|nr:thiazole synthase [Gemmatimonadota bacterium]
MARRKDRKRTNDDARHADGRPGASATAEAGGRTGDAEEAEAASEGGAARTPEAASKDGAAEGPRVESRERPPGPPDEDGAGVEEDPADAPLTIAGREFGSRLIVGTGKYEDNATMVEAIRASGAEMVTVAVRRIDLDRSTEEGILHHLDPDRFFLLANTAGCFTADEAMRYARLARAGGFNEWLKLEVIGDEDTLLPDVQATIQAAKALSEDGFKVMAYTNDDLVSALRLEDAGCVAVMPLASPIGSGLGVVNPYFIREIKRRLEVPVIVDAGVGTASDACVTMEQGVDGVLMNTALAAADDPVRMAHAMKHAVRAGRLAYLAGRMPSREIAVPSSPTRGMLD